MAVWAAMRPKSSGVTSWVLRSAAIGLEPLGLDLGLLALAALPGLGVDGRARLLDLGNGLAGGLGRLGDLELFLELLVQQALLEVVGDLDLEHAEVGGPVVELDLGVLGRAWGLLVGREQRVSQRVHQGVGVDSLFLLERLDGVNDLLGHAVTSVSSVNRFERRTDASGIVTVPWSSVRLTASSPALSSSPVKLRCPSIASWVLTRTRWPTKRS